MNRSFFLLFCFGLFFFSSFAEESLSSTDLDHYLMERGYFLAPEHSNKNEGYSSVAQRKAFLQDLQNLANVKKILEIGFNAGHSCELFLNSPSHPKVVSFDINMHPYTKIGVDFMRKEFKDRFEFIEGDSRTKVVAYVNQHLGEKFDLIFIDGCHAFDFCVADIQNCQRLAHKDTLLWIDDYNPYGVKTAVDSCVASGLITLLDSKFVSDLSGPRSWAIAKYQYFSDSERVFGEIYRHGAWGKDAEGNSTSGPGSSLEQGMPFVKYVQDFLESHSIQSVVDVGCGDWVLARKINWGERDYLGIDVVASVIKKNQAAYANENIHFLQLDVCTESLPGGDLLICKDVLMHLPNQMIFHILSESKKFRYCIFVNDVYHTEVAPIGRDTHIGGYRYLDLTRPPFNVKAEAITTYISGQASKQIVLVDTSAI